MSNAVAIEKTKRITFTRRAVYISFTKRCQLTVYLTWHLWTKRYYFINFRKVNAGTGFGLMMWPLYFYYQKKLPL